MSTTRRRGAPSLEPEVVARREWYESMQSQAWGQNGNGPIPGVTEKLPPPLPLLNNVELNSNVAIDSTAIASTNNTATPNPSSESNANTSQKPVAFMGFTSSVLEISNELDVQNSKKDIVEEIIPEHYRMKHIYSHQSDHYLVYI